MSITLFKNSAGAGGGADASLEGKYVRTTRFESIASGTTGTVTKPASSTIILDDFGGTVDAVISQETSGKPNFQPATTSSGEVIGVTFDINGDYVLGGTPSAYPVSLIYRVRQELIDFDSDASNIIGNSTIETTSTHIQLFTSSGTYNKPFGAKVIEVFLLAAGGGGGSGRKGAAGTVRCGGGAGGGGAFVNAKLVAAFVSDSVAVTVPAGAIGGTGISVNSTNGNAGSKGGTASFGIYLEAEGGNGGGGGTNAAGAGGTNILTASTPWSFACQGGASASATGGNGSSSSTLGTMSPTGGGAGGGITTGDVAGNGGNGGQLNSDFTSALVSGGLASAVAATKGGNGGNFELYPGFFIGTGGGGTRAQTTSSSGEGGDGGWGAGGGGSGAALDSASDSGNGGNGGQGVVMVVTYF